MTHHHIITIYTFDFLHKSHDVPINSQIKISKFSIPSAKPAKLVHVRHRSTSINHWNKLTLASTALHLAEGQSHCRHSPRTVASDDNDNGGNEISKYAVEEGDE
jgi:hypothetical protein